MMCYITKVDAVNSVCVRIIRLYLKHLLKLIAQ